MAASSRSWPAATAASTSTSAACSSCATAPRASCRRSAARSARWTSPPYVLLDGDDRSGGGGENLTVNLDRLADIKRVLVFAFIYDGVPAWDKADGVVTLFPQGEAPIEIRLDESSGSRMCALALLENTGGSLKVTREVNYINGAQDKLDQAYGWGMDWTPGRK